MSATNGGRLRLVIVAMTLANAMVLVDQTAVPLALPAIMEDLGVGSQEVQWVLTCSLLPLAGLLVLGGRLGDLLGRRRVLLFGTALFAGASAVGGLAPDLDLLLAARVAQGVGGALMLPATVAIVGAAFPPAKAGAALGTMGGAAAAFGALGPTIGGALTSVLSWRAVLLVNLPLAIAAIVLALRAVPADPKRSERAPIDVPGTALLSLTLVGLVFGLSQSQQSPWSAVEVLLPLVVAVLAAALFVVWERHAASPLVEFGLLRRRNYAGATISQLLAGMAEIGLGVIFPLLLILNMGMDPGLAGLALIPTTLPMIVVAPLAGRWYDRAGGRPPLVCGFALLALAGVLMALAAGEDDYLLLLPGLAVYGIGLALVLTTNDPVSLDQVPERDHGQASGVSATAEQFGGALGIAILYSVFHNAYLERLREGVDRSPLPDLDEAGYESLRSTLMAAESTGLRFDALDPGIQGYVRVAETAADHGYRVTFVAVAVLAAVGAGVTAWLVRQADGPPEDTGEHRPADAAPAGVHPSSGGVPGHRDG